MSASEPLDPLNRSLQHAIECYKSTQGIIRFLDTKAAAIIGYATVLAAVPLALLHQALVAADTGSHNCIYQMVTCHPVVTIINTLILVGSLIFSALVMFHALRASAARRQSNVTVQTLLFPSHDRTQPKDFDAVVRRLVEGLTATDQLSEYAGQIREVGIILFEKKKDIGAAVFWLKLQLLALVFFGVIALLEFLYFL